MHLTGTYAPNKEQSHKLSVSSPNYSAYPIMRISYLASLQFSGMRFLAKHLESAKSCCPALSMLGLTPYLHKQKESPRCDLNTRPFQPKWNALPACATRSESVKAPAWIEHAHHITSVMNGTTHYGAKHQHMHLCTFSHVDVRNFACIYVSGIGIRRQFLTKEHLLAIQDLNGGPTG